MSWFEAKGLTWARSALKEAVAHIDKALDIQEVADSVAEGQTTSIGATATRKQKLPGMANRECSEDGVSIQISSLSTSLDGAPSSSATWGSFKGSFFDSSNAHGTPITCPPTSASESFVISRKEASSANTLLESVESTPNSDSVELLSPPKSSFSDFPSPTSATAYDSESAEAVIGTSTTSTDDTTTLDSLRGSIVIIAKKDVGDREDDSLSYKTVVGDVPDGIEMQASIDKHYYEDCYSRPELSHSVIESGKNPFSVEDIRRESQKADSDSTQSFEDVQLQSSISQHPKGSKSSNDKFEPHKSGSTQNSNDEMETNTSSDIEIISNPNGGGDSSSANSTTRASPLKLKKLTNSQVTGIGDVTSKKGHYREPSEISILSEDSQSELDRLLHRISELTEVLETRELRLLQLEQKNTELLKRNSEVEAAIEAMKTNDANTDSAETYTQRLSALEKKFQASIRERDLLRSEIHEMENELQRKIPKEDLAESKAMVEELRLEGEKLSKEILQQSNIIKKLRTKEKNSDSVIKKYKEEISTMFDEMERLKRTLSAKEEVERTQIEAVHKMSSEKRKLDEENAQYRSKIEDLQSKVATIQSSFDAVKSELQQRSRLYFDLTRTADEVITAKKEKELMQTENQTILEQISELREKLRYSEHVAVRKEQHLREENKELLRRLEEAELRAEATAQAASMTTIPLMRQLESLQNTFSQRTIHWNQEEKMLLEKIDFAQGQLKSLENVEVAFEEKIELLQKRCVDLEEKLSQALLQTEKLKMGMHQEKLEYDLKERNLNRQITQLKDSLAECRKQLLSLEEINSSLHEKMHIGTEEIHNFVRTDELIHHSRDPTAIALKDHHKVVENVPRAQSPTVSLGRNSLEEVLDSSVDWQEDIECISNSGRNIIGLAYGMHLNFVDNSATAMEHLQSLLKQRDGELIHVQWELSRLQEERSVLTEEISILTTELEKIKDKLQSYETLQQSFNDLQRNYDAVLQMYGEKVERTEELELDLIELKEAYKTQINELLTRKST